MIYDAIVVGSGPGGAIAAAELARRGRAVLLADRQAFPRDKVCGDGLPASVMGKLAELGLSPREHPLFHRQINGIYLQSYANHSVVIPAHEEDIYSMVSPRFNFDHWLHEHALRSGARFEVMDVVEPLTASDGSPDGASAERIVGIVERKGNERIEHEAKVVIAADGASSVIARAILGRVSSPKETAIAIRAYARLKHSKPIDPLVQFYYLRSLAPGYAWVFPVDDHRVNVGLGLFDQQVYKQGKLNLKDLLNEFLDMIRYTIPLELEAETVKSWPIPVWMSGESRVVKGAYLIGDAGRFADALTGGGIFPAIVTGHLAALSADMELNGTPASEAALIYDQAWRNGIGRSLQRLLTVRNVLLDHPTLFNATVALGDKLPMIKGKILKSLAGQHA
jgi:geranylgeranyl reductase family protein